MEDLTAFQAELLTGAKNVETPTGQNIMRWLVANSETREIINHGQLYPNLDKVAEKGLIDKGRFDDRTNLYEITDEGKAWLEARGNFLLGEA